MKNPLDGFINFFAPQAGLKRSRARYAQRIYEGATSGRRGSSWKAMHTSQNAEQMYAIRPLRDRARDLVRNTPHATRMLDIMTSHSVGNGIVPVSNTGNDKIDNRVNKLWEEWQEQADITGQMDFYSMQALGIRSMIESGEVVFRFVDRQMEDKLPVPLQLQLLESDYIDQFRDGIYGSGNSIQGTDPVGGVKRSRLGVGLGEYDRFMGLWLFRNHPGELNTIWQLPYISDFVAADHLMHLFKPLRPGQVRGVPWMAPILMTARDLSDYIDAQNVKSRVEACFSAFITNDDSAAPLFDNTSDGTLQQYDLANPNASVTTLEPGMMKELRAGQDIKFANPTSTSQVEPLLLYNLQAMAAGVGCTYDQMSGDLRQANYSSLRAGKMDFWKLIGQLQKHTIIPRLCKPTWQRFISRAVLSGALPNVGEYPVHWVVPAKEMIDPKKDFDAAKNAVRSGAMTPQDFIASFGGDWRDTLKDFKAFFDMAHDMKITFDTDASLVDQHGRQPTKAKGEVDPADAEDQLHDDKADEKDDEGDDDDDRSLRVVG